MLPSLVRALVVRLFLVLVLAPASAVFASTPAESEALPLALAEECWLESRVACDQIPAAISDDDPALLARALRRWEESCGDHDLIWRTRILSAIWAGTYADSLLGEDPAPRLVRYLEWYRAIRLPDLSSEVRASPAPAVFDTLDACLDLEDFLVDMADQLLPHLEAGTEQELLVSFFAGDFGSALDELQTERHAASPLRESYDQLLARVGAHRGPEFEAAVCAGLWSPASGLAGVGSRPSLGGWAALRSDRLALRAVADLRVGGSKRDYLVRDGDDLVETGSFTGIQLGVEPAFALLRDSRTEILLEGGLGWYGVEALVAEPESDLEAVWLHSFARSIGLSVTILDGVETDYFANVSLRREWNEFSTGSGAEDIEGSAWLVRLSFGKRSNPARDRWRRALHVR